MIEFCIILAILVGPWALLYALPRRITDIPRVQAIFILTAGFEIILVLEAMHPRFGPYIGLSAFDYCVMAVVPIAAMVAGRRSTRFSHLFVFGVVSSSLFVSIWYGDSFAVGWEIDHGELSVRGLILRWLISALASGVACWSIGWLSALVPLRKKLLPYFPPLCETCRYDLRAHKSGEKCPECGTSIPSQSPHSATMDPILGSGNKP